MITFDQSNGLERTIVAVLILATVSYSYSDDGSVFYIASTLPLLRSSLNSLFVTTCLLHFYSGKRQFRALLDSILKPAWWYAC